MSLDAVGEAALRRAQEAASRMQSALKLVSPPAGDLRNYRLARALQYAYTEGAEGFGLEAMASEEYERLGLARRGKRSIFVPSEVIRRNLDCTGMRTLQPYQSTVATGGQELIETTFRGDLFIDALRPRSITLQLGVTPVGELVGNVQVPRLDTTSTAFWLTASGSPVQSQAITESEGVFDSSPVIAAPCVVGAFNTASRLLMQQTRSNLAETILSNDIARVLGTAVDSAVIQGSGSGGLPTGITHAAGTNSVAGATFALATAITAVQDLAAANAIVSRRALGWAVPPSVAGLLMSRMKVTTNSYSPIWEGSLDSGSVLGHPALASTNVPSGTAVFGDWSQAMLLSWGTNAPIEIEVNPVQNFATGDIGIRAMLSCNVVIRHGGSFSIVSGIT